MKLRIHCASDDPIDHPKVYGERSEYAWKHLYFIDISTMEELLEFASDLEQELIINPTGTITVYDDYMEK